MGLCMEAAAAHKLKMFVLDRPDPATGLIVDGPPADASDLGFTAYAPVPVAHGMTVGELARLFNVERHIGCDLTVVPLRGWRRSMWWDQTGLDLGQPVPQPAHPDRRTCSTWAWGCWRRRTCRWAGGRTRRSRCWGRRGWRAASWRPRSNAADLPGLRFVPVNFKPASSKYAGKPCGGVRVIVTDREAVEPVRAGLAVAWHLRHLFGNAYDIGGVAKLLKNRQAQEELEKADDPSRLPAVWREALGEFKKQREKYLIYN